MKLQAAKERMNQPQRKLAKKGKKAEEMFETVSTKTGWKRKK